MIRRSSTVAVVAAAAVALLMTTPLSAAASTVKAVEYPVAAGIGGITVLTAGPDGTVWFTEKAAATIGHITPHGVVHQFPIPPPAPGMPSPAVIGIATGSDGALWFASAAPDAGRMTTAGVFSWFPLSSSPIWVAAGPDGNLWYTEVNGRIARVSTAGAVTEFPAPPSGNLPAVITAGPDGAMWFSEHAPLIGRITTSGLYSEFRLDHPSSNACPRRRAGRQGLDRRAGLPGRGLEQRCHEGPSCSGGVRQRVPGDQGRIHVVHDEQRDRKNGRGRHVHDLRVPVGSSVLDAVSRS